MSYNNRNHIIEFIITYTLGFTRYFDSKYIKYTKVYLFLEGIMLYSARRMLTGR